MGIQVAELTQGKTPWKKEFIDFEFDGKNVSEFGLVVAFGGDRLALPAFPEFEDETSDVNGASGQLYWGTRFKTLTRTFNLVTDGMTEEQLRDFRTHFAPGKYGKFIEPHLLGRYSYCRVSEAQNFEVVPFRKEIIFMGEPITTNEYKGEINVSFCWDEPIFYAEDDYIDLAASADKATDVRKVYVNNLPTAKSFENVMLGDMIFKGYIGGGRFTDDLTKPNVSVDNLQIPYYNPSTYAKEPTIKIQFELAVTPPAKDGAIYFANIGDDINGKEALGAIQMSSQICADANKRLDTSNIIWEPAFKFTSPNVIYSINKAIQLAYNYSGSVVSDFEEMIHSEVSHDRIIQWAAKGIKAINNGEGALIDKWRATFNNHMLEFFAEDSTLTVIFDGENLEYKVVYAAAEDNIDVAENFIMTEEKSGNLACSPYLKLAGGDGLDANGFIKSCHLLRFDNLEHVQAISLNYKYCYI